MGTLYIQSVYITEQKEFDPNNPSNKPVSGIHRNPIMLCPRFPKFFQEAFIKSFVDGIKNPNSRMPDNEWQKISIRLRDNYITCPSCGSMLPINEFTQNNQIICKCGLKYSYPLLLTVNNYTIHLFHGQKLYACHTNESDDYNTITGEVIVNKNNPSL
jgi:hypothetical protein